MYSGNSGCTNASPSCPSSCVPFASNGRVYSGTSCTKSLTSSPPEDATGPVYSGSSDCTNASPSCPSSCVPFVSNGRVYSGTSFTNALTSSPPVDTTGFSTWAGCVGCVGVCSTVGCSDLVWGCSAVVADCVWTGFSTLAGCVDCTGVGFTIGWTGLACGCSTLTGSVWVGFSTVFSDCVFSICFCGLTVSLVSWPVWTTCCVGCTGLTLGCSTVFVGCTGLTLGCSTVFVDCTGLEATSFFSVFIVDFSTWILGCATGFVECVGCCDWAGFLTSFFSWDLFSNDFTSETSNFKSSLVKYPTYL